MQLKQKMIGDSPISGDVLKVKGRNNTEKYCQMWPCEKLKAFCMLKNTIKK